MMIGRVFALMTNRLGDVSRLFVDLTDGCNSRCQMCDIWKHPRRNLSLTSVEEIAQELPTLRTNRVFLTGGEPMLHPQWPEIAERFRGAGAHVELVTNGLLLRRRLDEVARHVDGGVVVSLDGATAETYKAVRGVDGFHVVLDGIGKAGRRGIAVTTRTTIQRSNFREIPQIIELVRRLDVKTISFLPIDVANESAFGRTGACYESNVGALHSEALSEDDIDEFDELITQISVAHRDLFRAGRISESPAKLRLMVAYFRALIGQGRFPVPRCNRPLTSLVIGVDGSLKPCFFLPSYGRLTSQGLAAAVNEPAAQQLRREFRTGQRQECEMCVCPHYRGPLEVLRL
jgi:MoaA/NifB/PqqE/SkfB family radical SAM enzyme